MSQTNGTHATNGREWRLMREEGLLVQLPSSQNWVRLRRVAIDALILAGRIPDLLTPLAAAQLWEPKWVYADDVKRVLAEAKSAKEYTELLSIIVPAAMMEPRCVDSPQADDEISLDDLDYLDKFTIYNLATQPLGWLHSFRAQQAATVEPVLHSEDNQPAPEPVGAD